MIKVQPAGSRVVKTETPDRLALVSPRGPGDFGGVMLFLGAGWIIATIGIAFHPFIDSLGHSGIVLGVISIPGIVLLFSGLVVARRTWTLERTATELSYTRSGLAGTRVRRWPAEDVTSVWVEELKVPRETTRYILRFGFRNGRSEDVLIDTNGEEVRWLAAMLKDAKGERRPMPTARAAPDPVLRKADPSVVPVALTVRRFPTGVGLTFLPLIDFKHRWWKLMGKSLGWMAGLLVTATLLEGIFRGSYPAWITWAAIVVWFIVVINRLLALKESTVIQILDGLVTIVQNQGRGSHQFAATEVEFIQTFRGTGDTELQFLLKGRPKLRLLRGRPGDELEWAGRFLRLALKGRPDQEAAPLKVDAVGGECQVCGEKMESRVVFCAKCRTPHHEECWSYVGQCSTYGCREIRFTRA